MPPGGEFGPEDMFQRLARSGAREGGRGDEMPGDLVSGDPRGAMIAQRARRCFAVDDQKRAADFAPPVVGDPDAGWASSAASTSAG